MAICSDKSVSDIVKTWITNTAELKAGHIVHIVLNIVSCVILIICLDADYWLSGDFGNQGLWTYCYKNGTADCCARIDDVIGYKAFIGATRAFLIIESVLYLGIFYTIYSTIHNGKTEPLVSTVFTGIIGVCTFISITVYGARHGDVADGKMNLHVSYAFCALNLGIQLVTFFLGLTLFP